MRKKNIIPSPHVRAIIFLSALCTALTAGLTGCSQMLMEHRKGDLIRPEQRHPLPKGEFSGHWETNDVIFDYHGTQSQSDGTLTLSSTLLLAGRLHHFDMVRRFHLDVWLVDREGRALTKRRLFNAGYMVDNDLWQFQKTIELPRDAVAMAFGYTGEVLETGDRSDMASFSFWRIPFE